MTGYYIDKTMGLIFLTIIAIFGLALTFALSCGIAWLLATPYFGTKFWVITGIIGVTLLSIFLNRLE